MRFFVAIVSTMTLVFTSWVQAEQKSVTYQALAKAAKGADTAAFRERSKHKELEHDKAAVKVVDGKNVHKGSITLLLGHEGSEPHNLTYEYHAVSNKGTLDHIVSILNNTTKKLVHFVINDELGTFSIVADGHAAEIKVSADESITSLGKAVPDMYHAIAYAFTSDKIRDNVSTEMTSLLKHLVDTHSNTKGFFDGDWFHYVNVTSWGLKAVGAITGSDDIKKASKTYDDKFDGFFQGKLGG